MIEYPLGESAVIGRGAGAGVRLADREVSRQHGQLYREGDSWFVRDLGSSNGTSLNGKRIFAPARLAEGDEIAVGSSRLEFRLGARPGGAEIVRSRDKHASVLARAAVKPVFLPAAEVQDVATLKRDYERLRIGHEFAGYVRIERDLDELLARILQISFDLIPADSGVVLLRESGSRDFAIVATRQRRPDGGKVLVSETLLLQVEATKEGVLTSDAAADERFAESQSIIGLGVRAAMAVPLVGAAGEVKGIMFLDSRERVAAFTAKDLEVLTAIAAQASVALENTEYARALEREAAQRAQLARFLSPALVEQAARGSLEMAKGGALTELTILFADIRGFTAIAEKLPAQEVVRLINDHFELMVDVLFEHGGILDKFIGDALMGWWGAPVKRADDAARAVRAAVRMQERLAEWNASGKEAARAPISIGIGLHTGHAVVGNMGSSKALSYTAIGDAVNLASHLCAIAPAGAIVISDECAARAGRSSFVLEPLPPAKVKNRAAPVLIHRVARTATG
jgi:adenylate cyclase